MPVRTIIRKRIGQPVILRLRREQFGFSLYLATVSVLGWVTLLWFTLQTAFEPQILFALLFWCALAVVTEFLPVPLPQGGYVTLGFPIIFAATLLFGPVVGSWVAVSGAVLGVGWSRRLRPYQIIFNGGQLSLTVMGSAFAFYFSGGRFLALHQQTGVPVLPVAYAVITYFLANSFAVSAALGLQRHTSPWSMWLANFKGASPNYLAQAPLAILMALIYHLIGWWAVLFSLMPIYVGYNVFRLYSDIRQKHLSIIRALAAAIEMRDPYTEAHSQRMADYAVATARGLRISIEEIENIRYAAILHDIGKIGISDRILRKPGPLTATEYRVIQQHSRIGAEILEEVEALKNISEVLYHHHERYDGKGYPDGIKGDSIPIGARIICVIDAYDAMTSQRPYRLALGHERAIEELRRGANTQFDPGVVDAFIRAVERDRRSARKTA